ncbi:MAG: YajQ family cyclic di-GMP-binding protein [Gammaproteobacteria bacterium]|nr:YajQ family cyclic di-GMP-binding protein [Gammaproteobacteria bacterium]MBA3732208.1 YajQ family cyclic di-GMP-binding protein [Gammaproteobacteria bacterium]
MPTFDVVSEVDLHEVANAVDQTSREVANRYDFKGMDASLTREDNVITLQAQAAFQLKQMLDILAQKLARRGVDVACMEEGKVEESGNRARQLVTLRRGIDAELARKLVRLIKDKKLKVQTSIQGEKLRVSGKSRDDLQQVIGMLREEKIDQPLQFENFRD